MAERRATGAGAAGTARLDHPSAALTETEEGEGIAFTYTLLNVNDTRVVTLALKGIAFATKRFVPTPPLEN